MPRVKVTGYLDEGVDSRDVERLLPPRGQWKTTDSYGRCGSNSSTKNSQHTSNYIYDTKNILQSHQNRDKKVQYGPLTATPRQDKHQSVLGFKQYKRKEQPPYTYGPSKTHCSDSTKNDGLHSPISTWRENDSQSA
eukprot:scaffold46775_cov70-Cyclotella_meneghiniana.AAC.1